MLKRGGYTVATVSLSWGGGAGGDPELIWRYEVGKQRLQDVFELKVIEMPHTLSGSSFIADHPELRAQDLMDAFLSLSINGIFTCIGGNDSIRLLPYLDLDVIAQNPKVFLGYSDSTVTHLVCYNAGFSSFYGPSILAEFAENREIYPYTSEWVHKALFTSHAPPLEVEKPAYWTSEYVPWIEENRDTVKQLFPHEGYRVLQGDGGVAEGPLLGGCIEVLLQCINTPPLWPDFSGSLLFLESSEEASEPPQYREYLLQLAETGGVFSQVRGILIGKPYQGLHEHAYEIILMEILRDLGLSSLVVATNLPFGHNEPMCLLPYGAQARFDCRKKTFTILERGVEP